MKVKRFKFMLAAGLLTMAASSAQAAVTSEIDFNGLSGWTGNNLVIGDVTFTGTDHNYFEVVTVGGEWDEMLLFVSETAFKFTFEDSVSAFSFNAYGGLPDESWVLDAYDASGSLLVSTTYEELEQINTTLDDTMDATLSMVGITLSSTDIAYATMTGLNPELGEMGSVLLVDNFTSVSAVPEPSTYALMLGGLGLVGFMSYRRRKTAVNLV